MKKSKLFFETVVKTLNPFHYNRLSERISKHVFHYFFSLVFVAFALLVIVSVPMIWHAPAYLNNQFEKFEIFNLKLDVATKEPITITGSHPFLTLTTDETANLTNEQILVKRNALIRRPIPCMIFKSICYFYMPEKRTEQIQISNYSNILEHKTALNKLFIFMFVMMLPMLLLIAYILFAIKYLIIIFFTSFIALIVVRLLKFHIDYIELYKIAVYSSTLMILVDVLNLAFNYKIYYAQYIIFLVYLVCGIVINGESKKNKHKKTEEYFELENA